MTKVGVERSSIGSLLGPALHDGSPIILLSAITANEYKNPRMARLIAYTFSICNDYPLFERFYCATNRKNMCCFY